MHKYRNTETRKYRNTEIRKYRNTEIQKYRNTEISIRPHLVVLAAGHDPLAAGDGEVGEHAVLLVLVPGVGLQALALRVVPQLQGVVERGRQDVLAVGRELDEGHGRVVVVDEGLEALAGGGVPDPAQPVVAAGDDQAAVPVEVDGGDGVRVGGQGLQALPRPHVPDTHLGVRRSDVE